MPANGHYFRWLVIAASMVWSGCSLRTPLQTEFIGGLRRLEYRNPDPQAQGIIIGVPHGKSRPVATDYAITVSDRLSAGLIHAYVFSSHGIAVSQPVTHVLSLPARADTLNRRGSIYPEFKALPRKMADGGSSLYPGIRMATEQSEIGRIKIATTVLKYGKIESIPGKSGDGVVVGAPHGTFDVYTSEMVRQICARTGLAGVIATGFTPRETGSGWRINVNRPSERYYPSGDYEIETSRAAKVYESYKSAVTNAARGPLHFYIDVHQNSGERIEVATVGVSKEEARFIKNTYRALRDRALAGHPEIAVVDLAIEPLDIIEVGAWATKATGILQVAKKSLHFELPGDGIMASSQHRRVYTPIISDLISRAVKRITAD